MGQSQLFLNSLMWGFVFLSSLLPPGFRVARFYQGYREKIIHFIKTTDALLKSKKGEAGKMVYKFYLNLAKLSSVRSVCCNAHRFETGGETLASR